MFKIYFYRCVRIFCYTKNESRITYQNNSIFLDDVLWALVYCNLEITWSWQSCLVGWVISRWNMGKTWSYLTKYALYFLFNQKKLNETAKVNEITTYTMQIIYSNQSLWVCRNGRVWKDSISVTGRLNSC